MHLEDYANTRGLSIETARKVLIRPEVAGSLKHHVTTSSEKTELDEDAVAVLDEYIGYREGERARTKSAQVNSIGTKIGKRDSKTVMIIVTVAVFILLLAAFILKEIRAVPRWVSVAIIIVVTLGVVIFYMFEKTGRKQK